MASTRTCEILQPSTSTGITGEASKNHCNICDINFKSTKLYISHLKTKHKSDVNPQKYACDKCDNRFNSLEKLTDHLAADHPGSIKHYKRPISTTINYPCKICNIDFTQQQKLDLHIKREHKKGDDYACKICNHTSKSFDYLINHMKRKHSQLPSSTGETGEASTTAKNYLCEICNIVLTQEIDLRDHIKNKHKNGKYYVCDKCTFRSQIRDNLIKHIKKHSQLSTSTGETSDPSKWSKNHCTICDIDFNNIESYISHLKTKHKNDEYKKKYACDKCKDTFKTVESLTNHLITNHPESVELGKPHRTIKCEICDVLFFGQYSLTLHIQEYHRVFACDNCLHTDKNFRTLSEHVKTCKHPQPSTSTGRTDDAKTKYILSENGKSLRYTLGEYHALYTCNKCNYTHKDFTNVTEHVKTKHVKQRQLSASTAEASTQTRVHCSICPTICDNKNLLRLHYRTHHKINNKFACNKCNYTHIYMSRIKQHIKVMHSKATINCLICLAETFTKHEFEKHKEIHRDPSNSQKWLCPYCQKTFGKFASLDKHNYKYHLFGA